MIYTTVDGDKKVQTYQGFRGTSEPKAIGVKLAIVFIEGGTDAWYLDADDPLAVSELARYYRADGFQVRIQVFENMVSDVLSEML